MKMNHFDNVWKCGLLAIDKCKNITSAKLVDKVKYIIKDSQGLPSWLKLGHGGTLDESASGVLVLGTGLGCKLLPSFLHGPKKYNVRGRLGVETDTYNECGNVTKEMPYEHIREEHLKVQIKQFTGNILQKPPQYSALKIGGIRASDLTRSGINVQLDHRPVKCYKIVIINFNPPFFDLQVTCGGGFYVRSLIHDLGVALGTCAHVLELRRIKHGFLMESDALPIDQASYSTLLNNVKKISESTEFRSIIKKYSPTVKKVKKVPQLWVDPT